MLQYLLQPFATILLSNNTDLVLFHIESLTRAHVMVMASLKYLTL